MKKTKKLFMTVLALVLAVSMSLCFCSCGDSEQAAEEETGVANPVHECESADDIVQATGISLDAPEGATDVAYSYIDATSDDGYPIAQVEFTLDGQEYCYRCQMTDELSLCGDDNPEADPDALMASLNDQINIGAELAGIYCEWESAANTMVSYCDAVCGINEGKEGFVAWLDVVPGALYSLSMDKGANQGDLTKTAEKCFVPMQGEVDGDEE
ncbi:MAG: hypothetical protein Q4D99_01850 [Bacillota bacterium]|nr:hypothetical protein [Bacillota bacterium]